MMFKYWYRKSIIFTIFNLTVYILSFMVVTIQPIDFDSSICQLTTETKEKLRSYVPIVQQLRKTINGEFKNRTYNDLEDFIDTIGPRLSGSKGLVRAITYLSEKLKQSDTGVKSVKKEKVTVPKQKVGTQYAELIIPRKKTLSIIPTTWVRNTPSEGIVAKVVVVNSMNEFKKKLKVQLLGKILVLNFFYESFDEFIGLSEEYRFVIDEASKMGVAAILVKSLTTLSLYTTHNLYYTDSTFGIPTVPVATLALEDAELLGRMNMRGQVMLIFISIQGYVHSNATSYNVISDYEGTTLKDELVVISGHMDNVKVGLGAQDDGIGLFLSLNTARLLNYLNLRPKRTIRLIFWTSEEFYLIGSNEFIKTHTNELLKGKYRAALEADGGCAGLPRLIVSNNSNFAEFNCLIRGILIYSLKFKPNYSTLGLEGLITDVRLFENFTIPLVVFAQPFNGTYWWYWHSAGDMMNAVGANDLDTCLLMYATVAYIISDLETLPNLQMQK